MYETNEISKIIADKAKDIGININEEDYRFLNKLKEKEYHPILIGLGGSYAYGTNVETSDVDIRGIALNSPIEIIMGRDFENVVNEATDTTIYSLKKMVSLLIACNPNTIEIIGLKPEQYLYLTDAGKMLIDNKHIFLSKKCIASFMGYANSQMYRLQQKTLVNLTKEEINEHIVKVINGDMLEILKKNYNMDNISIHLDSDSEIVFDMDLDNYPVKDLTDVLNCINKTIKDYTGNSMRNNKAIDHGKVCKHAMHLLRLYMMCEDILLYGEINTYREKEHDLLMDIRNGKYLGEDEKPNKEFFDIVHDYENRIQIAKEKTELPDKPDYDSIEKLVSIINIAVVLSKI